MKNPRTLIIAICVLLLSQAAFAQVLQIAIKNYLHRSYKGWKLSPTKGTCDSNVNPGFVSGEFNGDGKRDYAVKFGKGGKGYIISFSKMGKQFQTICFA